MEEDNDHNIEEVVISKPEQELEKPKSSKISTKSHEIIKVGMIFGFLTWIAGCPVSDWAVNSKLKKIDDLVPDNYITSRNVEEKIKIVNKTTKKSFHIGRDYNRVGWSYIRERIKFNVITNIPPVSPRDWDRSYPLYSIYVVSKYGSDSFDRICWSKINTNTNKKAFFRKGEIKNKLFGYDAFEYDHDSYSSWAGHRDYTYYGYQDLKDKKEIKNIIDTALSYRSNVRAMKDYPRVKKER